MKNHHAILHAALAGVALLLSGCAGNPPADPVEVRRAEELIMAPFETERTIVADELVITMTANFHEHLIRTSMVAGVQEEARKELPDGGTEYLYMNHATNGDPPMRFKLGQTEFGILSRANITVLGGRNDMTLKLDATGNVTIKQDGRFEDCQSVRIENGSYRRVQ